MAFGAGAALTLDEFALWLTLSDVYWEQEGRVSVDAVLVVGAIGSLLVLGANPFDTDPEDGAPLLARPSSINLVFAVLAAFKGKIATALLGVFVPIVSLVGTIRLAKPGSPWARKSLPPRLRPRRAVTRALPRGPAHAVGRVRRRRRGQGSVADGPPADGAVSASLSARSSVAHAVWKVPSRSMRR